MTEQTSSQDITFAEIFARLWKARVWLVVVPLCMFGLVLAGLSTSVFLRERPIAYFIALSNISNDRYPNGTQFSPQDLVSPPVLSLVREKLKLPPDADLANNVQAVYDSAITEGISQKYKNQLAVRNLSQAEINSINDAYTGELKAAINSSIRISVNYKALGVDEATGFDIARAIPTGWEEIYTTRFRTLVNTQLGASAPAVTPDSFHQSSGIIKINSTLLQMTRSLEIIKEDNRLSNTQNAEGLNSDDILDSIDLYKKIYYSPIYAAFFKDNNVVSNVYIRDKQLQIEDLTRQIDGLDASIDKIQRYHDGLTAPPRQEAVASDPGTAVQMDEGALRQVVDLAEKASMSAFLQETLQRRQEVVAEISGLRREIDLVNSNGPTGPLSSEFSKDAFSNFKSIADSYNGLLSLVRERAAERSGSLFAPLVAPAIQGSILSTQNIALLFGALVLGFVLSAIYAIFKTPRAEEDQPTDMAA